MPIFIYAVMAFLYFFQIIVLQENLQMAMTEAAKEVSQYTYIYNDVKRKSSIFSFDSLEKEKLSIHTFSAAQKEKSSNSLLNSFGSKELFMELASPIVSSLWKGTFLTTEIQKYINTKDFNYSCIQGGYFGISFLHSSLLEENDVIDIVAVYRIKIPIPFISIKGFTMVQRVRTRGFVGTKKLGDGSYDKIQESEDENEQTKDLVYITEQGTVYHKNKSCSHLKLQIECIVFSEVSSRRNESEGKYKECLICINHSQPTQEQEVYITMEGDRYHSTLSCSGLKRTIIEIPRSEIKEKPPCQRCGQS